MPKESPIFTKSHEMLEWLLAHTRKFPKEQRFVMAKRVEEAALGFHDALILASRKGQTPSALERAEYHLSRLKVYNRLCTSLRLQTMAQYEHLSRMLDELGRLLGGWQRKTTGRSGEA